jgi:hypothetical protein
MDNNGFMGRFLKRSAASPRVRLAGFRQQRGVAQSLVEFAMITPIMFTLFLGILEFGWLFNNYILVNSAAREAARTGAVAGQLNSADASILHVITMGMQTLPMQDPVVIKIYKAQLDGSVDCTSGVCYEDQYTFDGTNITADHLDWPPLGDYGRGIPPRQNQEPTDDLGVSIEYNHHFLINLIPGAIGNLWIRDHAVVKVEPAYFAPRP